MMQQPLTGKVHYLCQSTVDYMERMRVYCVENIIEIEEIFKEDDEENFGCVPGKSSSFFKLRTSGLINMHNKWLHNFTLFPEFIFLYIIRKKFRKQTDFSMDQVYRVADYLKVPDGKIWYAMLHTLMDSGNVMCLSTTYTLFSLVFLII